MGGIVSFRISMIWAIFVVWVNLVKGVSLPLIFRAGVLPCWIMFFVLGVALGQRENRNYKILFPLILTLVGFVYSVCESSYLYEHFATGVGIKPSAFIFSFGVVLLFFSAKTEKVISRGGVFYKAIVFVGNLSFGIYLTHCYMLQLVDRLNIESWSVRFFLTISITMFFIAILRSQYLQLRLLLPVKVQKYLGI